MGPRGRDGNVGRFPGGREADAAAPGEDEPLREVEVPWSARRYLKECGSPRRELLLAERLRAGLGLVSGVPSQTKGPAVRRALG